MATEPDWESNTAPRKKHGKKPWLSAVWPWIAAGAFMGLMASLFFLLKGLAAFQQGTTDVGIGYMVLMALFPPVTIFAAWRSGREEPPSSKAGDPGERRWLSRLMSRLMSLMDMCGHLMPLVLLMAGGGLLAGGLAVLIGGRVLEGAIYIVMGIALPMTTAIPMRWMGIVGKK